MTSVSSCGSRVPRRRRRRAYVCVQCSFPRPSALVCVYNVRVTPCRRVVDFYVARVIFFFPHLSPRVPSRSLRFRRPSAGCDVRLRRRVHDDVLALLLRNLAAALRLHVLRSVPGRATVPGRRRSHLLRLRKLLYDNAIYRDLPQPVPNRFHP